MSNQRTEEEQKRQIVNRRHFSFRLNMFFFSTFVLFSMLIVQLAILQFVKAPELKAMETKISTRPVLIPPIRGDIYDSTGTRIAYSTSTQSLYYTIDPQIKEDEARRIAEELHAVFEEYGDPKESMTVDEIIKEMDINFRINYATTPRRIKSNLTNEEIAHFMENKDDFEGMEVVEESIRNYDESTIAVQLVGYLKKYNKVNTVPAFEDIYGARDKEEDTTVRYLKEEDVGVDGIELMYQDVLRGKNGVKTYPINSQSAIIGQPTVTKPEKGSNLYLTINKDVQLKTEEAIMNHLAYIRSVPRSSPDYAPYARAGYAVAMEVDTGKVVAMASMPDYDPNVWKGGSIDSEDYKKIQAIQYNGTIRQVVQDWGSKKEEYKHTSSLVYLGSTQKPLSVLIGMAEKVITPYTRYNDNGSFYFGKEGTHRVRIKNAGNHAYGLMDPARAIEKSSNPFMAEMIGNQLYHKYDGLEGVETWDKYVKQFGLGVSTESGLPWESSGVIDYFHEAEVASAQSALIRASFGQQARYTVLQLAQYTATLANRGKRMKPLFVEKIVDQNGNVVEKAEPVVLNEVDFPAEYWKVIERGMKSGVQGFEGVNYSFNRKTGTSEQKTSAGTVDNAVFIAYAPADKPKLAVAVVVPEGGFGGRGAAPIARKIFDAYDEEVGLYGTPRKAKQQESDAADAAAE
ncbi:peptidoglycan D,D-transpeptidase FtsI family protein [Paenibacillus tarimensis]|uniref:peptidoglycan D,D-transpeptidase FtsI family protein n=1 Tax=Paenibacillus tarimensis TaxID=416012 RepID=UPI001F45E663|nr:penicillin-binding transpeptidase domain-containing protein [Paenibacillus tarimensis]MCF2943759.1 penicillin-binding protein 2 [Paenibacillus tarimensis]